VAPKSSNRSWHLVSFFGLASENLNINLSGKYLVFVQMQWGAMNSLFTDSYEHIVAPVFAGEESNRFGSTVLNKEESTMFSKVISTGDNWAATLLRLTLGVIFFAHGAQKVLGLFGGYGYSGTMNFFTHQMGIPAPFAFLAIMAEFLGGIGLILGFLGRIAAFGILCNMIVAICLAHYRFGFFMNWTGAKKGEGFEYHLLAMAIALAILIRGSGAASVDRALTLRRP
jgi:putative oxidoreductase